MPQRRKILGYIIKTNISLEDEGNYCIQDDGKHKSHGANKYMV